MGFDMVTFGAVILFPCRYIHISGHGDGSRFSDGLEMKIYRVEYREICGCSVMSSVSEHFRYMSHGAEIYNAKLSTVKMLHKRPLA
jgi:hypothetical protein